MRPLIAVCHVHKTAGTTLSSILKRNFGPRHCAVQPPGPVMSAADLVELLGLYPKLASMQGHAIRLFGDLVTVPGLRAVTFLRDPLRRTASHYQYDVQRGDVHIPFDEWVTHDAVPNRQVRQLAGEGATARDAIALIEEHDVFVGLTERFDESLVMLGREAGLWDLRYTKKLVAKADDLKASLLADPASRAALAAVNDEDHKLYEWAVGDAFASQVAAHDRLDRDVARLRRRNRWVTGTSLRFNPNYLAYQAKWRLRYLPWTQQSER